MAQRKGAAKERGGVAAHKVSNLARTSLLPEGAPYQGDTSPDTAQSQAGASGPAQRRNELSRQVLELRMAGFSFREICQVLGLRSCWEVWRLQRRALKQHAREGIAQLQQLEWARLDRLIRGLWRQAVQGDLPTLDRLLRLLQQRERYVRQWAKQTKSETVPRMTLLQALAADRQLEAWLQQHRPQSLPPSSREPSP